MYPEGIVKDVIIRLKLGLKERSEIPTTNPLFVEGHPSHEPMVEDHQVVLRGRDQLYSRNLPISQ